MHMRKLIIRFRREEEGAALVEYGMLVGLIAVICVVGVQTVRRRPLARPLTERLAGLAPSGADALSPPS